MPFTNPHLPLLCRQGFAFRLCNGLCWSHLLSCSASCDVVNGRISISFCTFSCSCIIKWAVANWALKETTQSGSRSMLKKCRCMFLVGCIQLKKLYAVYASFQNYWFLPRCMECRRGLAMRILSVRLSA